MSIKKSKISFPLMIILAGALILLLACKLFYFDSIYKDFGLDLPIQSSLSVSEDESLMGSIYQNPGEDMYLEIKNISGKEVYKLSLQGYNPSPVTTSNTLSFSPDNRKVVFEITDKDGKKNLYMLDLGEVSDINGKKIYVLKDSNKLGDLALSSESPLWVDNKTIIYENYNKSKGNGVVFVDTETFKEVAPRIDLVYRPSISHSKKYITFIRNGSTGTSTLVLYDNIEKKIIDPTLVTFYNSDYVSRVVWSPDDNRVAILFAEHLLGQEDATQSVLIYDIEKKETVMKISEYYSNPDWVDDNTLSVLYYDAKPFMGQNIHQLTKANFYNLDKKSLIGSFPIKSSNFLVLSKTRKVLFFEDYKTYLASIDDALNQKNINRLKEGRQKAMSTLDTFFVNLALEINSVLRGGKNTEIYKNENFGISFNYPSDFEFAEASGPGYMNIIMGKSEDGLEIALTSLSGEFEKESFQKEIINHASKLSINDFEVIEIGKNKFYRTTTNSLDGVTTYKYYLYQPVVGKTWLDLNLILTFTLKSFGKNEESRTALQKILESLVVEDRKKEMPSKRATSTIYLSSSKPPESYATSTIVDYQEQEGVTISLAFNKQTYTVGEKIYATLKNATDSTIWIPTSCGIPFSLIKRNKDQWDNYGANPIADCKSQPIKLESKKEVSFELDLENVYAYSDKHMLEGRYKLRASYTGLDPAKWSSIAYKMGGTYSPEFEVVNMILPI